MGPTQGFTPPPQPGFGDPARVLVTPSLDTLFAIGESVSLGAVVVDEENALIPSVTVTWSSRSPEIATVDVNSGRVTAQSVGTAIIDALAGSVSGQSIIVVEDGTAGSS